MHMHIRMSSPHVFVCEAVLLSDKYPSRCCCGCCNYTWALGELQVKLLQVWKLSGKTDIKTTRSCHIAVLSHGATETARCGKSQPMRSKLLNQTWEGESKQEQQKRGSKQRRILRSHLLPWCQYLSCLWTFCICIAEHMFPLMFKELKWCYWIIARIWELDSIRIIYTGRWRVNRWGRVKYWVVIDWVFFCFF